MIVYIYHCWIHRNICLWPRYVIIFSRSTTLNRAWMKLGHVSVCLPSAAYRDPSADFTTTSTTSVLTPLLLHPSYCSNVRVLNISLPVEFYLIQGAAQPLELPSHFRYFILISFLYILNIIIFSKRYILLPYNH